MKNLYQINSQIEMLLERAIDMETGEIKDEGIYEEFKKLLTEQEELIEQAALAIRNEKGALEAVDAERIRLDKIYEAGVARIERLKESIKFALKGEKYKTPLVNIYYRTSQSTVIDNLSIIPKEYLKYSDPEPRKSDIKKAINEGKAVPGARIEDKVSIIIK